MSLPPIEPDSGEITRLLSAAGGGDSDAMGRLLPLVYEFLREQAERSLRRERNDHTLQPTALVHEAWLRLADERDARFHDRGHFLAVAGMVMRRILVDHARSRSRLKRGGGGRTVELDEALLIGAKPSTDLVALDEALELLGKTDVRLVRIVEMRFFAGLSVDETASALGVGSATVKRDWALARAWLKRELMAGD